MVFNNRNLSHKTLKEPPFPERLADGRRPLKRTASDGANRQTDRHRDSNTESAHWATGPTGKS